jgi:8-oxo-dGTP pyrophosphatase MutT (NUDIX family)
MSDKIKINKKKIICGNCGKIGHVYRNCKHPIMSLGIVSFKIKNNNIYYLLIRRKDTLGFVEFLRGKYDINDSGYISKLFSEMTTSEVKRILTLDFDTLWKQLWMEQTIKNFKNDYEKSKERFYKIKEGNINILSIIKKIGKFWDQPEWGFPKGRRNIRENDMDCAIREFKEETGYDNEDIKILKNIDPICEQFFGSNNVEYKHSYFIAQFQNDKKPKLNRENKSQISEVSNIGWFTYQEAKQILRPYNIEKINVLTVINNLLQRTYSNDKNMLYFV